jgi:hypothetical protein
MNRYLLAAVVACTFTWASYSHAELLYVNDFESEALGSVPSGWQKVWDGATTASVIADPVAGGNQVLASSDLAHDASRHDVGGSIYGVGDATWTDYVVQYDALYPTDFYIGTLFRYQDDTNFYLLDRRSAGELGTFTFYHHDGGWNALDSGTFDTEPMEWYRFRLSVQGDTFEVRAGLAADDPDLSNTDPFATGTDAALANGVFALYGLIYIDNVIIGETGVDISAAVEPHGKLATTWASLRR